LKLFVLIADRYNIYAIGFDTRTFSLFKISRETCNNVLFYEAPSDILPKHVCSKITTLKKITILIMDFSCQWR